MKRFLPILFALPLLLAACETPSEDTYLKPCKWNVFTAHNGASYRAPKLFARFDYVHPVGIEKKWETLNVEFWSNQEVFPLALGYDGSTFMYHKSPYPEDHIGIVITKEDDKYELYKEFATTAQLFHLGEQLTYDENANVYIHAEVVDMTITADVPLFGREAGSNLVDKFGIMCIHELVDFATYDVLDTALKVQTVEKIKKTLLQEVYGLQLVEIPEEQYDKVTFTITMDIRRPDDKLVALTNNITVEFEN